MQRDSNSDSSDDERRRQQRHRRRNRRRRRRRHRGETSYTMVWLVLLSGVLLVTLVAVHAMRTHWRGAFRNYWKTAGSINHPIWNILKGNVSLYRFDGNQSYGDGLNRTRMSWSNSSSGDVVSMTRVVPIARAMPLAVQVAQEFGEAMQDVRVKKEAKVNVTRVGYTLYKMVKLFGARSFIDCPAGWHAEWMVDVVKRLSYEQAQFRYIGMDSDAKGIAKAKRIIAVVADGEYLKMDAEVEMVQEGDFLFYWPESNGSASGYKSNRYIQQLSKVMSRAKKGGIGLMAILQEAKVKGGSIAFRGGKWVSIDDRRVEPFLLNSYVKGAVPVGDSSQLSSLYLTLYSLRSMSASELQPMGFR